MRALRVVGVTGDGSVVLEDPGRRERYTVPADEQLRAAARGDVTRLGQIAIELESQLRPREIQARIRGGASVVQVAEAAGVPVQKIERFAYPVLLERSRTAELAQGAHPHRADGPDVRTLGETVAHTFGLRGQDYGAADWDSWKGDDGKWVVALSWRAGRSDNAAHWSFQPGAHGGTVVALDEHASDLVEGLPARPLRTVGPVIDISRDEFDEPEPTGPESPQVRAAASGEARTAADPRRGIAPEQRRASPTPPRREAEPVWRDAEPERGATAYAAPPRPDTAGTERPASPPPPEDDLRSSTGAVPAPDPATAVTTPPDAPRAGTRPPRDTEPCDVSGLTDPTTPAERSEPVDRSATVEPPTAPPVTPPEPETPAAAATTERDQDDRPAVDEPAPEQADAAGDARTGASGSRTSNRRTKKGKPVMPSWDEVLLGVRGQR